MKMEKSLIKKAASVAVESDRAYVYVLMDSDNLPCITGSFADATHIVTEMGHRYLGTVFADGTVHKDICKKCGKFSDDIDPDDIDPDNSCICGDCHINSMTHEEMFPDLF